MDSYYEDSYGHYSMAPTAYSNDASFGAADLGHYESYDGYPMQRVTSGFSHSSFDSAVPADCLSPITVDSNFEYDNHQATYSSNHSTQQPYSPVSNASSYRTSSTQGNIPRTFSGYQGSAMTQTSSTQTLQAMQPSSVQTSKPAAWTCLYPGCKQKPFRRHADLDRHLRYVHLDTSDNHYCDYRKCSRSEGSFTGEDERAGRNPFHRWDHYKAHLRDYHKEPIPKRGGKENSKFFDGRPFPLTWWRCSKCLKRNHVNNAGYKCSSCSQALEASVIEERQRRYPNEARTRH